MATLAPEAEVEAISRQCHSRQLGVPLKAPIVSMIVAAEYCLQSFELEERLHERYVLVGISVNGLGAALAGCDALHEATVSKPDCRLSSFRVSTYLWA